MQTTKPNIPAALKSDEAKRTTIILERSEREYIEQLIKDGKEPGIKPLISKMLSHLQKPQHRRLAIPRRILLRNQPHSHRKRRNDKHHHPIRTQRQMVRSRQTHGRRTQSLHPIHPRPRPPKKENWEQIFQTTKSPRPRRPLPKRQIHTNKNPSNQRLQKSGKACSKDLLGIEFEVRNPMVPLVFEIKQPKTATD